ncbi:hypothetical protein E5163_06645 [Marinicauda algicola]|uniref:Lipoprotein n=1 Tax=Marinicauda algicola TaxID=2029849 RepID=A0A4S2H0Q2_9PROT|nr:hypothetical protein [Marinicauda algicola]TGY88811.1 hypothetical protein E5163_06645 [Marinicauda algicola]
MNFMASAALAAGTLLLVGACASQTDRQALVDAGQATGVNSDGERVRCDNVIITGSRQTRRVCLTHEEWAEMEESAQRFIEHRQEDTNVVLPSQSRGPS